MITRLVLLLTATLACAEARQWRSAEGSRTVEGEFIKLAADQLHLKPPQGQPVVIKLSLLSIEDQSHAQACQAILAEALKQGAKEYEIVQPLSDGPLCRLGVKMSNGSTLFTGEPFLLLDAAANAAKPGTRSKATLLYPAGQRTFHPTQGQAHPLRVLAMTLEQAATHAATSGPDLYEPVLEISEARGLGFVIDESGLVLVDAALVEGATGIDIDIGSTQQPGVVQTTDAALGLAVLACKAPLIPARLAPRKPVELGQTIFAMSFGLSSTKRSIGDPAITKGIISKLSGPGSKNLHFQHDAAVDAEALGGVVLSEKGDVLGLMQARANIKASGSRSSTSEPLTAGLGLCLRSEAITSFLKTLPKVAATKAASTTTLAENAETLRKSVVIVKAMRQKLVPVTAPALGAQPANGGPATGWSLSKSGIRHNARCRYYDAAKPCQASDGTPCKVCKG
jgi:S1-C subfamily serine protease